MAIGIVFDGANLTQAQYEQVKSEVFPGGMLPKRMLYHAAGPTEQGWRVVEVWESQEDAQRFFDGTLGPSLQRSSIEVQPQFFQVVSIHQP
jgi:hypothetical protein